MTNKLISNTVTPLINDHVSQHLEPRGFTTNCTMIMDNEESQVSVLRLCDPDNDIGTYQFYIDTQGSLVVTDYHDVGIVFGTYNNAEQFKEDFDLPITFNELKGLLSILAANDASAFIGIDSVFIDHPELMLRTGWTDRRIKKEFGIVPKCEIDNVSYYRLNEVLAKEI
ncbi:hypothetical protein RJ495_000717 [Pluralibacter gergoviae]|nr:hypothetical protein [Pluralibacter gergoviae]